MEPITRRTGMRLQIDPLPDLVLRFPDPVRIPVNDIKPTAGTGAKPRETPSLHRPAVGRGAVDSGHATAHRAQVC